MRLLLCLLLLAAPLPGWAAAKDLASIKRQLATPAVLKGRFEQARAIKVLRKPLKSSGRFVLAKGTGLLWQAEKPLPSLLRITREQIAQLKDGKAKVFVDTKAQPGLSVVGKILFAVFSADVDELQRHFEFISTTAKAGQPWTASLRPLDKNVAKVVVGIEISGGRTVHELRLAEANGDSTVIRFLDVSEKAPLSPAEAALFE